MTPRLTPSAQAYIAVVVLFVTFGIVLYKTDALVHDGTEQSAKIVAATLVFAAGFIAAVVSVFGILIKHSIDSKAEARQQLESERNAALSREAEDRLKLDTVVRTIQLFGHEGAQALPVQRAGALIALCSLNEHELAVALAADLVVRGDLEPATAAVVIDRAVTDGTPRVKVMAAELFFENSQRLLTSASYEVPMSFFYGHDKLPFPVRQCAILGLARLLLARPIAEWRLNHRAPAFGLVMAILRAWRSEVDDRLKRDAAAILKVLLDAFDETASFRDTTETVDLVNVRMQLGSASPTESPVIHRLIANIREWSEVGAA